MLSSAANDGATPAHLAASFSHCEILSLLGDIDPGSLMLKDHRGNTPAHDATRRNRMPTVLVLIERCPSLIYVANNEGLRPIEMAEREEMKHFLQEAEKRSMVPAVQLQTLAKENRQLASQNAVLTLYSRNTWQSRASGGVPGASLHRVAQGCAEYAMMQAEFSRTMSKVCVRSVPGPGLNSRRIFLLCRGRGWHAMFHYATHDRWGMARGFRTMVALPVPA